MQSSLLNLLFLYGFFLLLLFLTLLFGFLPGHFTDLLPLLRPKVTTFSRFFVVYLLLTFLRQYMQVIVIDIKLQILVLVDEPVLLEQLLNLMVVHFVLVLEFNLDIFNLVNPFLLSRLPFLGFLRQDILLLLQSFFLIQKLLSCFDWRSAINKLNSGSESLLFRLLFLIWLLEFVHRFFRNI